MRHTVKTCVVVSALLLSAHSAAAQDYDPGKESPLSLLAVPKDPVAYYDARARAQALIDQDKAAEAEPIVEQITRDYPRDGENWVLLGTVKRVLKKYAESAAAFERAGELLWWGGPAFSAASAATAHLLGGNKRGALDLLRHYTVAEGNMDRSWIYDDEDFVSLRSDPEFQEIAGRPDVSGWSRDYGWRRDLEFVRDEAKRLNADYRTSPLPPEFERRYEELKQNIPRLTDEQIYVGMNRMLAVLRQGHTGIWAVGSSRVPFKGLPFQLYAFPEGLFIVSAPEPHGGLVGSRLISIDGVPAEEALRRVNETQSVDGDNEYLFMGVETLHDTSYLAGLGVAKSPASVRVTVQKPGQARRTLAVAASTFRDPNRLLPPPGVKTPLFLRRRSRSTGTRRCRSTTPCTCS